MNSYMKAAIEEAEHGIHAGDGGPFGCVIVKDGEIIGKGHNEVVKRKDPTCHGEIMAIHEASRTLDSFDLSGCELYTTGEPCPMCMGAILWANIDRVYYGCNIADTEEIGFRDKVFYEFTEEKKAQMVQELDRAECRKLYRDYQDMAEKTSY
ncbi:MAG: nucleoside deaminase [bacterium]|nr:nucleoside deaminase [bacterium]MDY4099923.1 nucleoside deaminase [Lachnospiraceae bacterium]